MKEVKEVATGSASFSGEDTVNPVSVRGNVSFHSTANAPSETSISSSSDAGRNPLDMKSNLPTACSEKMEKRGFWKSPFQSNQQEIPEFPHVPVVHVVGESPGDLGPCMMKFKNGLYLPLNKHMLFFPHFLQDFLHKTVRFYLKPVEDEATSHNKGECKRLNESLRYLDATFEYCKEKTSHVSVRLWENHGKSRRQHRNRPLFSSIVYVDTETKSVVIKGQEFHMTVGVPFPSDVYENRDNPGGHADVGLYIRQLDTNPDVRMKWYISLRIADLPYETIARAIREVGR